MSDWLSDLPLPLECFALQRPGREDRFGDPPFTSLRACVAESCEAIEPLLDRPYVLFGHSLGGYLAFQVAALLHARGAPSAKILCISSISPKVCPSFQVASWNARLEHMRTRLISSGDIDEEALMDLLATSESAFKADLALYFDCLDEATSEVIDAPVVAVHATQDNSATRDMMSLWRIQTRGQFKLLEVFGDHMYTSTPARKLVADFLVHSLSSDN